MTGATHRDRLEHLIGGEWVPDGGGRIEVEDPATEQLLASVAAGTAEHVEHAVASARDAWPGWAASDPAGRADHLRRLAEEIDARADQIAATVTAEVGMPLRHAEATQVRLPVQVLRLLAAEVAHYPWREPVGAGTVLREPSGVVAAITPWNVPLHQIVAKVGPALAAGCTVVLKPSEIAPLNAYLFADCVRASGLPAGVLNLVCGTGAEVGEALVTHPDVAVVSLTGSVRSGVRVAELAARDVKRVCLELGGKSPNVLLDDADLDSAVPNALAQAFFNSGQACNSLSRLLVPAALLGEVESRLVTAVEKLVVGDPFDAGTDLGPLVSAGQRAQVLAHVAAALADGARLLVGGTDDHAGHPAGHYLRPTVFSDVTPSMRLGQDEVFGPVLAVQPYRDLDDAVAIANSTAYGLSAGIWSADRDRAASVAGRLRAGQVKINGARTRDTLDLPFGGYRHSGIGRELGRFGIDEFVELKALIG